VYHFTPVATGIIIITVLFTLFTWYKRGDLFDKFLFYPYRIKRSNSWYEFITHGFLHGSMGHLIFNMLTLFFFGFSLEMMIGSVWFAILYFVCMVIASLPDYIRQSDNPEYRSVGASGAISGILFSAILFFPYMDLMMIFLPIPIPAPIFGLLYLAYSWFGDRHGQDNIGHNAHLWGALAGLVITALVWPESLQGFMEWISYKLS
jgi:membrane associated rhomboid family serine protease